MWIHIRTLCQKQGHFVVEVYTRRDLLLSTSIRWGALDIFGECLVLQVRHVTHSGFGALYRLDSEEMF